ncbi:MAG: GrpB family protein [Clostridia bacterium]|nr:GrpB family protein [Clostridia bacterium]
MIGLKRGTVELYDHQEEWDVEAKNTIQKLKSILGDVIISIDHVGSTSIPTIKAKPIIDIMIVVKDFDEILKYENKLQKNGYYYRPGNLADQLLFASGSFYEGTGDMQTHFIHVVLENSVSMLTYVNFKNFLIKYPKYAKEYENVKSSLENLPRNEYIKGKMDFIQRILRIAQSESYIGKEVYIKIDRPKGSTHPKHKNIVYPVNYGYIEGVIGGDGEELDVYLLGVDEPVTEYKAKVIGVIHRLNDNEDKLVASPVDKVFTKEQIIEATYFQEQYFESEIFM